MPIIAGVAVGRFKKVYVFGSDYETQDGTGERDYVHVSELAKAHMAALEKWDPSETVSFNLGSGKSYSVLDLIKHLKK